MFKSYATDGVDDYFDINAETVADIRSKSMTRLPPIESEISYQRIIAYDTLSAVSRRNLRSSPLWTA